MVFTRLMLLAATFLLLATTAPDAAQPFASNGAVGSAETPEARNVRLLSRIADDLAADRKAVLAEAAILESELERVLPLEAPERKEHYRTVSDRYRDYGDRILEAQSAVTDLLNLKRPSAKEAAQALQRLEERNAALAQLLRGVERKSEQEADRVARIIERRTLLLDILRDLLERRDRLEAKRHDREERHDDEKERAHVKKEIELRQLDLLSLGAADEDLLRHYLVAAERMRGETDWLETKRDEYEALRETVLAALPARGEEAPALRSLAAWYDRAALRLERKVAATEKKSSDVAPSGTLRQLDRSREMQEAFASLRERYLEQAEKYRLRSSDYTTDAEMAVSDATK